MTVFMPIPIPMPAFALGLGYMFYGVSGAAKVNCASLRIALYLLLVFEL